MFFQVDILVATKVKELRQSNIYKMHSNFVTVRVIVTVIMILAMFIFYFCLKQQDKHCIRHYDCDYDCDYDKKIRYVQIWSFRFQITFHFFTVTSVQIFLLKSKHFLHSDLISLCIFFNYFCIVSSIGMRTRVRFMIISRG